MKGVEFGISFCGVIKLPVHIFLYERAFRSCDKIFFQVVTKGFQHREEDEPRFRYDGEAFHKVKIPIPLGVVHGVEPVQACQLDKGHIAHIHPFVQAGIVDAGFIVAVNNAQLKAVPGDLAGVQVVHVFHHQVPGGHLCVDFLGS